MKEILKNVKMNFKLNRNVFILACVIYLFLLIIGLALTLIIPFSDVLTIIFIFSPFTITFSYLALKSTEGEILDNNDVYSGYKVIRGSFSIVFRRIIVPILFSILIGMGIYMILFTLDLMIIDNEFYKKMTEIYLSQDLNQISLLMDEYSETMNRISICMIIGVIGLIISFNIFANKKILSYIFLLKVKKPFINYDFLIKINRPHYKYKTFWFDVLFSLPSVIGFILAVVVSNLLLPVLENVSIIYLISVFIFFLFTIIVIPFKYLMYSEIFNKSFTEELDKLKETYND